MELQFPTNRYYTQDHEWVQTTSDAGIFLVGITCYATEQLGDVVFIDTSLVALGQPVEKGQACATIESIKSVADIYSPLSGTLLDFNTQLETTPEEVGSSPYEKGWIFRIQCSSSLELSTSEGLLEASAYASLVRSL